MHLSIAICAVNACRQKTALATATNLWYPSQECVEDTSGDTAAIPSDPARKRIVSDLGRMLNVTGASAEISTHIIAWASRGRRKVAWRMRNEAAGVLEMEH